MKLQVLAITMHEHDFSKVEDMNLRNADVIIANQTDHFAYEEYYDSSRNVHASLVSTNTRGASLNRNIAMSYATGDIVVYADDDMYFVEDAAALILNEFDAHPEADVIKFGCVSTNPERPFSYQSTNVFQKANMRTLMCAGVHALAIRRDKFMMQDITFPTSIGPGKNYNCGEDSSFIKQILHSKLRVYRSPLLVAYAKQDGSSWFTGYNEHYYKTVGYVYAKLYGVAAFPFMLRRACKERKYPENTHGSGTMLSWMLQGFSEFWR